MITWNSTTRPNLLVKIGWSSPAFSPGLSSFKHRIFLAAALSKAAWTGSESAVISGGGFFLPIANALRTESTTHRLSPAINTSGEIWWHFNFDLGILPSPAYWLGRKQLSRYEPHMNRFWLKFKGFEVFFGGGIDWSFHGRTTDLNGLSTELIGRSTVVPRSHHGAKFLGQARNFKI